MEITNQVNKPSDKRLKDAFVNEFRGKYAFLWGEWHSYDPDFGYWQPSRRQVRRDMLDMLADQERWTGVELSARKVEAVLRLSELYLPLSDEIEIDPDLIPLANGVYAITGAHFEAHKPENYFLSAMDYSYVPSMLCPIWLDTLAKIVIGADGQTDFAAIDFIQEMFGYSLWGDNRLQASFFLFGEGGTGKSTVLEVAQMLTDNKASIDLETLNEYQMATLVGVRLVVFNELERGAIFPEAAFKRLVSSDTVMARLPYGRPFTFQPIATVVGAMNQLPPVRDRTRGVWRRVYPIPFDNIIKNPDTHLISKLRTELPGIFNWAVVGLARLRQRGKFAPPALVTNALAEWRYENDIEKQFLSSEYVELDANERVQTSVLYQTYIHWCKENGYRYPKAQRQVAKEWERLGLVQVKDNQRYWQGIKIPTQHVDLTLL